MRLDVYLYGGTYIIQHFCDNVNNFLQIGKRKAVIPIKTDFLKVKRDIKAECARRGLKYADLAKMTGYTESTVKCFMMQKERKDRADSERVAAALIVALNLDRQKRYQSLLTQITDERSINE